MQKRKGVKEFKSVLKECRFRIVRRVWSVGWTSLLEEKVLQYCSDSCLYLHQGVSYISFYTPLSPSMQYCDAKLYMIS